MADKKKTTVPKKAEKTTAAAESGGPGGQPSPTITTPVDPLPIIPGLENRMFVLAQNISFAGSNLFGVAGNFQLVLGLGKELNQLQEGGDPLKMVYWRTETRVHEGVKQLVYLGEPYYLEMRNVGENAPRDKFGVPANPSIWCYDPDMKRYVLNGD